MTEKTLIFHIANRSDLVDLKPRLRANTSSTLDDHLGYQCESLALEGFIHCCDRHQLKGVVSRYYQEIDDVELLLLDVDKLEAPLVHENTVGGSELFPHLYGPININAIVDILPFGINSDERLGLEL